MAGSIKDWSALFTQAMEHLKPGGWIELQDAEVWASTDDNSLPEDSNYHKYQVLLNKAAETIGIKMNVAPLHEQALIDHGFKNVKDDVYKARAL